MRSMLLMSIANIKKKRMQSLLIGLTMIAAALTLSTAIGIFDSLSNPVDRMFTKLNASQDTIYVSKDKQDPEELINWLNSQKGISAETSYLCYESSEEFKVDGKALSGAKYIAERPSLEYGQDKLQIVEGDGKKAPAPGEIWLPTGFAYLNKIKVGDTVTIAAKSGSVNLKVSAIEVDAQSSSPIINPVRVWVAEGELEKIFPGQDFNTYSIGIKYADYSKAKELWKDYEKHFNEPFMGSKLDYSLIKYVYTYINSMLASVLVVFSIILIAVMVLIIGFTIISSVISDYKTIGILKAQGFSKVNINLIYVLQYFMLAAVTIPAGIFLSTFMMQALMSTILKSTGTINLDASMAMPSLVTVVSLLLIIFAATLISSRRAGTVKPVEAIRQGTSVRRYSKRSTLTLHRLKRLPLNFSLGIKQIFINRRQTIFIMSAMCLAAFSFTFFINVFYSVTKVTDNMAYYGLYNADVMITTGETFTSGSEALLKEVKEDDRVKYVVRNDFYDKAYVNEDVDEQNKRPVILTCDGDMDALGMINMEGRNATDNNEISLGVNTAKEYKKSVGDYLEVYIGGKKKSYLVVGIYQTISNGGRGMRIQYSALKELDPEFVPDVLAVVLKDGSDSRQFIQAYKQKYDGELSIEDSKKYFTDLGGLDSITGSIGMAMLFTGVVFFIVSFITISNTIMIDIYRDSKNFGIYKSLGMTARQLRSSIQIRITILTLLSATLGMAIGRGMTPVIMEAMMSRGGVSSFPISSNIYGWIGPVVICIFIALLSSWIPSVRIRNINTRELINE